jgi:hypothetical protein
MTLPSLLLGLICSVLIGAVFHLWRGGGGGRLLFYLALSVAGFAVGHWFGNSHNWVFFSVGPLNLGMGVLGSILFLAGGYWLSLIEIHRSIKDDDGV